MPPGSRFPSPSQPRPSHSVPKHTATPRPGKAGPAGGVLLCSPTVKPTDKTEERYRDILDGLATYFASPFVADILATVSAYAEPDLGGALNRNQMTSKLWLADALASAGGARFATITILGGWFGVLGAMLLSDRRLAVERVVSVDIDPRCAPVARSMNASHGERFAAITADMLSLDYAQACAGTRDLIVNTACEHLPDFSAWFSRLPSGALLALQSNDYFACREHVNCVPDLTTFRAQAPLAEVLFAGSRRQKKYTRFMLIGRK